MLMLGNECWASGRSEILNEAVCPACSLPLEPQLRDGPPGVRCRRRRCNRASNLRGRTQLTARSGANGVKIYNYARTTVEAMTKTSFKSLKRQAEDIYKRYEAHFAGKPRATRDLDLLDELIGELDELVDEAKSQLNGGRDPAMISLLEMAKKNRDVYRTERQEVMAAKEQGPSTERAGQLVTEANLTFGRYHRHFANENRRTRDPGLLTEIIVELERIRGEMKQLVDEEEGLREDLETVEGNLEMYRNEFRAIEKVQESGTAQEQSDVLASLANDQFALYRQHFAGKPRPTRRPGLLERVVSQLKRIHKRMFQLKQGGLVSEANERNMEIVSNNLDVYQSELDQIREARASVTAQQLGGSLGGEANEIMAEYREEFAGENRSTRDLEHLSLICDRMCEIAYQMRAIQRDEPSDTNAKNLTIVLDSWTMYESEYRKVEEAQKS